MFASRHSTSCCSLPLTRLGLSSQALRRRIDSALALNASATSARPERPAISIHRCIVQRPTHSASSITELGTAINTNYDEEATLFTGKASLNLGAPASHMGTSTSGVVHS